MACETLRNVGASAVRSGPSQTLSYLRQPSWRRSRVSRPLTHHPLGWPTLGPGSAQSLRLPVVKQEEEGSSAMQPPTLKKRRRPLEDVEARKHATCKESTSQPRFTADEAGRPSRLHGELRTAPRYSGRIALNHVVLTAAASTSWPRLSSMEVMYVWKNLQRTVSARRHACRHEEDCVDRASPYSSRPISR
jgi:hypothetical protein